MSKSTTKITFLLLLIIALIHACKCNHTPTAEKGPIRVKGIIQDSMTYKRDEVIVAFKQSPTPEQINTLKHAFYSQGITDSIQIRKCSSCDATAAFAYLYRICNTLTVKGMFQSINLLRGRRLFKSYNHFISLIRHAILYNAFYPYWTLLCSGCVITFTSMY